jgi:hypothetical protein
MKRTRLIILMLAAFILPCGLFGLFVYQENMATAPNTTITQSDTLATESDEVKESMMMTEQAAIQENQDTTTTDYQQSIEPVQRSAAQGI